MKRTIIQFGMIRTGSTLIYNILKEIFIKDLIIKTHKYPSKWQSFRCFPIICTYRDPLDIICSSIKRNKEFPNRKIINKHISILKEWGFDDFIKLEKRYPNKCNLKYEDFHNNFKYVFDKLETFLDLQIPNNLRDEIENKWSIPKVKGIVTKYKSFAEYDKESQIHGLHISDKNGEPKSFVDFFSNDDIDFLKSKYKDFRLKYQYD